MRIDKILPELVELAPTVLQPGRLYISSRYRAAVHLCCCGCGEKVVTPLSRAEWQIQLADGRVSLYPSIGNWSMACQSHYWIRDNNIVWSYKISSAKMKAVFERDQRDLMLMHRQSSKPVGSEVSGQRKAIEARPIRRNQSPWHALWNWLAGR